MERTRQVDEEATTAGGAGEAVAVEVPDYWQRVESPVSKTTIFAYAGGMLAFGAICGAAAALVIGRRPPKPAAAAPKTATTTTTSSSTTTATTTTARTGGATTRTSPTIIRTGGAGGAAKVVPLPPTSASPHVPVKITPSSALFALKALAAGTALCLSGALAVRWVVYTSMGVSTVEEFADKMRRWAPEKAKQVGLVPSRESAYWTQRKLEEEGAVEEGKRAIGLFEHWFGVKFDDDDDDADNDQASTSASSADAST